VPNHLVTADDAEILAPPVPPDVQGRMSLVKRAVPIRFECVVRGYLDGSAWREYQTTGVVSGRRLPLGLKRYDKLPEAMFTPARKNLQGHDENVLEAVMANELGDALTFRLRQLSLDLYNFAHDLLLPKGIILLDTKFEFGQIHGQLVLIDEIFTPDSSRMRVVPQPGKPASQGVTYDKQLLRDWLTERRYQGEGPPPSLDEELLAELSRRYQRIWEFIAAEPVVGDKDEEVLAAALEEAERHARLGNAARVPPGLAGAAAGDASPSGASASSMSIAAELAPRERIPGMVRVHVIVHLKPDVLDVQGQAIRQVVAAAGHPAVAGVEAGKSFYINLNLPDADDATIKAEVERLCHETLSNPLIERFEWKVV
jgi:phosphoribosylaminoimidazole-succinocarboxamide synthase